MRKLFISICLISITSLSFGQVNMTQGLQLHLPFNGNAQDASGNGNNGAVNGATLTQDQNSTPNSAYYFDGINDFISVPHHSSLNQNVITVCAKVKMMGFNNGFCYNNVILNKGFDYQSSTSHYSLRTTQTITGDCSFQDTTNHNYRFDFNGNGTLTLNDMNNAPYISTTNNNWDCLIGTYDGTTSRMYVNGVLRYQYTGVQSKPLNTYDLRIGKYDENTLYPFWFTGNIDEVRIYNRVLNPDELNYYCSNQFPESTNDYVNKLDVQITPNPSSSKVDVNLTAVSGEGTLFLSNTEGRIILSREIKGGIHEFVDVSKLANGLYLFTIEIKGQRELIKFLKN